LAEVIAHWAQAQGGSISLEFLVETRLKSQLFESLIDFLEQYFPNCVPWHTGVLLKRLKCAVKVLCFEKNL